MFPSILPIAILGGTGALDHYIPAPCRLIVKSIQAACSVDPGDAETITVAKGSTTVGVLTFGSTIAAGAVGTYVADTTGGETIFEKGEVIKLTISALTAASAFNGYIEVDEFCKVTQ